MPVPMPSPGATPLPQIQNDPTLVHSGSGQIELAATNTAGDLIYSHWRDEAWGNTVLIKPNTAFNPAIRYMENPPLPLQHQDKLRSSRSEATENFGICEELTAVGQHLSGSRQLLFQALFRRFRDPQAIFVGNKIVVVFADSVNHLYAIAFDIETGNWGQQAEFRTGTNAPVTISFAPAIAASDEEQVDVVYVKSGGSVFHRVIDIGANNFLTPSSTTDISFRNSEIQIPGTTNASPVLTVSTYKQPELFVRGTDNKLYHNHFVYALGSFTVDGRTINPGWQGWALMDKFIFAATPKADGRVAEFAAAGTRSGKTEILARALPKYSSQTNLNFHNEFDSNRFAVSTNPWKTVNWRGWEATSSQQQFFGTPADRSR